jgi:hypothetical protein
MRPEHIEPDCRLTRVVAPSLAALLVALAFLPIVDWVPGGRSAPWYGSVLDGWLSGTAIAAGAGLVLAILSRRLPILWREGLGAELGDRFDRAPWPVSSGIAIAALLLYALLARAVFDARPLLIDELAQMVQARIFAGGALTRPVAERPEFFSMIHVVDLHGRVYSQFPPGGPFFLALGVLLRSPWMVGPVFGAIAVVAYARFLRVAEPRPSTALLALVLFAFAPFTAFMAASHMNHVPTLALLLVAIAALARVMTEPRAALGWSLLSGLGFGVAATIRPIDALAFALPAGVWYLWRALRDSSRWRHAFAAALGIALPVLALAWVNVNTTGAPLLFGYVVLWGPSHSLGFHQAPWGVSHSPARGLELVSLYFLRLQSYLFETPIPSLLPAIGALALTRKTSPLDRYLAACTGLLVGLYFAYWHDGFFLGPRFLHPLLPVLALWTARLFPLVHERAGSGLGHRSVVFGFLVSLVIAAVALVPLRAQQYRNGLLTMRWDARRSARDAGVRNALVFVRESWGAQLVARMWAIGVPRSETEKLYRGIDACLLEQHVTALENSTVRDTAAFAALQPLLRDSSRVRPSPFSPDTTERHLPGSAYTRVCARRIEEDRAGFTLLPPLLAGADDGNVYARDLHQRNAWLARQHPDRALWLLKPATSAEGDVPRFYPLRRDSVLAVWSQK